MTRKAGEIRAFTLEIVGIYSRIAGVYSEIAGVYSENDLKLKGRGQGERLSRNRRVI